MHILALWMALAVSTPHSITVTWKWFQGKTGLATEFVVLRSPSVSGTFQQIGVAGTVAVGTNYSIVSLTPPALQYTFVDSAVTAKATYCYKVIAANPKFQSPSTGVQCKVVP